MNKPPISVPTESRPTPHELVGIVDGWRCSCGERMSHNPDWMTAKNAHNKHVAASSSLLPVRQQIDIQELRLEGKGTDHIWLMEDGAEPHTIGIRLDSGDSGVVYVTPNQAKDLAEQLTAITSVASLPVGESRQQIDKAFEGMSTDEAYQKEMLRIAGERPSSLVLVLAAHWLTEIHCDHEAKTDEALCYCGWRSPAYPSVGRAVEHWARHVSLNFKLGLGESREPLPEPIDWKLSHPTLAQILTEHEYREYYLRGGCACGWGTVLSDPNTAYSLWVDHICGMIAKNAASEPLPSVPAEIESSTPPKLP